LHAPSAGLCDACAHQRLVGTRRGARYSLCRLSSTDPGFPKYPSLPVRSCPGFEPRDAPKGSGS